MSLLSKLLGRTTPAAQPRTAPVYSVFDTETTGLSPHDCRIIEIAIVRLDANGHVIDEWASRFNPEGPVYGTHIHGITDADVRNAPLFAAQLAQINARLAGTVLVAHNARFDMGFLREEYARAGWVLPPAPVVCTLNSSRHYLPGLDRRKLADCCQASGVRLQDAHSALGDARATAGMLQRWLPVQPAHPAFSEAHEARIQVPWPSGPTYPPGQVPRPAAPPRQRSTRPATRRPAKPSAPVPSRVLASRLRELNFRVEADEDTPDVTGVELYVDKLLDFLADGVLTDDEAAGLRDLAALYDLDDDTVAQAHQTMVRGLVALALLDSKVSSVEKAEINRLAEQLGVPNLLVSELFGEVRALRETALAADLLPLPEPWLLGEPLRIGDKVVFTGGDPAVRDNLEELAGRLGIEVMSSVSRFTTMLVSDGLVSNKSSKAAELGTRVVTFQDFAELLKYRQPAG